jgi:GT2 family glycosyltransferase
MSKSKILAIVVTYNGRKWLDSCFGSLLQSSIPLKIIAIDNGSSDGTPEIIKEKFPDVELIISKTNLGFGQANNMGLRKALDEGADYVFLLNQDAWVEKDTIKLLVDAYKQFPEYGIISPVHLDGAGTGFDYGFLNYLCRSKDRTFLKQLYVIQKSELNTIYPLDFINAAFWLIPRSTLETVGGFNPLFYHYGEDREYVNRCFCFGLKTGFVPLAIGYHDRLQTDSEAKKKNLKKSALLIKALNPNERYSWLNACGYALKSSLLSLVSAGFNNKIDYLKVFSSLLKNRRKITHSKKLIKKQGPTYIS